MNVTGMADTPNAARSPAVGGTDDLAIYIHWPFCLSKCPYCDFNTHVRDEVDQLQWRAALLRDLEQWSELAPDRRVTSMFFGGGTPSLMDPATVAALIDRVSTHWQVADDVEITLEANPTSVEAGKLIEFRAAGVNRVSLGIQALNDRDLLFLGRNHSALEAIKAIELADRLFGRFSFDLIYARPEQTVAAWREELAQALSLAGNHLSAYQLTIEPGTAFHARKRRGELETLKDATAAALFEDTQTALENAGLLAYEVSNHAKPGSECRHNLTYWRYGDYAGIGPGAHGRLTSGGVKYAYRRIRGPEAWLHDVEKHGHGMLEPQHLSHIARFEEMMMMGLRLTEFVPFSRIESEARTSLEQAVSTEQLQSLVDGGFLELGAQGLRATATGRQRLDAVLTQLLC
jgi:putative oxygen-independent coproporphyrinogen III oxidase